MLNWSLIFKTYIVESGRLGVGIPAYVLAQEAGVFNTRTEAKHKISQGGFYVSDIMASCTVDRMTVEDMCREATTLLHLYKNRTKITTYDYSFSSKDINDFWGGILLLPKGVLVKPSDT